MVEACNIKRVRDPWFPVEDVIGLFEQFHRLAGQNPLLEMRRSCTLVPWEKGCLAGGLVPMGAGYGWELAAGHSRPSWFTRCRGQHVPLLWALNHTPGVTWSHPESFRYQTLNSFVDHLLESDVCHYVWKLLILCSYLLSTLNYF